MRRTWCSAREQRRIQDDCGHARQCTEAAARPLSAMQRKHPAQHDDVSTSTEGATAREERSQLGRRRCRRAHEAAGRRSRQRAGRQVCAGGVPLGADGRVCACLLLRRHYWARRQGLQSDFTAVEKKLRRAKPPHTSDGAHAPRRAHGPPQRRHARRSHARSNPSPPQHSLSLDPVLETPSLSLHRRQDQPRTGHTCEPDPKHLEQKHSTSAVTGQALHSTR